MINLDTSFFSVVCELKKCRYMPETDLENMTTMQIIDDIRTGQLENILAVMEYNPVEGWCRNITEEILAAASPALKVCTEHGQADAWHDYRSEMVEARRAGIRSCKIAHIPGTAPNSAIDTSP